MSEQLQVYEAPQVTATVEPQEAFVGDTVTYRIEVTHPAEVSVKLPTRPDVGELSLNGVDHQRVPVEGEAGSVTDVWTLQLGVYRLEDAEVPAFDLEVVTPDGPARLPLAAQSLTVKSLVAEEGGGETPRELAPPESVFVPDFTLLWVLAGAVGLVVLALLARRLWQRLKGREKVAPPAPPRPLEVRTREALEGLRAQNLVGRGRRREYFFRLSEIVRGYLGERFSFEALECTTSELRARLRDRPTPGLELGRFSAFTELSDLVKFAKYEPTDDECGTALTDAFAFVDETTRAAQAAQAQQAEVKKEGRPEVA